MTQAPERIWRIDRNSPEMGTEYVRADLVPQWQPIETAPKDGRLVLARWHSGDEWTGTFTAYYSAPNQSWMYGSARPINNLSHWAPLLAPPEQTGAES